MYYSKRLAAAATALSFLGASLAMPVSAAQDVGRFTTPVIGFYVSVPLGGPQHKHNWNDKAEYGLRLQIDRNTHDATGRPRSIFRQDMLAVRFRQDRFDRFSLTGQDIYLRDGSLSLYADGEGEKEGSGATMLYIGLGAALVGGSILVASSTKKTFKNAADCLANDTNCPD